MLTLGKIFEYNTPCYIGFTIVSNINILHDYIQICPEFSLIIFGVRENISTRLEQFWLHSMSL